MFTNCVGIIIGSFSAEFIDREYIEDDNDDD